MRRLLLATIFGLAALPQSAVAEDGACTTNAASAHAAVSAVAKASPGAVVCLTDGRYGRLELDAAADPPGVTVRAEHPGKATVAGATLDGTNITLAQFRVTGQVTIGVGSSGMTVAHNLIVGQGPGSGNYGVMACAATPPDHCDDISVVGNRFVGRFDEDAIRANVYHDGPDRDPYGLLIEGNEFTGNVEYGGHNDVFQSVWTGDHLYIRRNYLHDFGGQGIFIKDQSPAIDGLVVEDNLIVRQDLPCDPDSLCPGWQLAPLQIFGPIANGSIRHNTVWPTAPGRRKPGGPVLLREGGWTNVTYSDNVVYDGAREAPTTLSGADNARCTGGQGAGVALPGETRDCSPAFADPARGDYRLRNGRGVTWKVADQQFGPGGAAPAPAAPSRGGLPAGALVIALAAALLGVLAIVSSALRGRSRRRARAGQAPR